jgi:DNA polymerase (family 10)
MNRKQVAAALEEIGVLLELTGENPFKTRAYHNAARTISGLDEDLATVVAEGRLGEIPGIGKALEEKITLLVRDGVLPYLDDLRAKVPEGLFEWLRIPGLGPKKVRAIHGALDITTLGELEYACKENRLRDLDGFGETSQRKILDGIERVRRHAGRFLQPVVRTQADRLVAVIGEVPGVTRTEVCGSVRRRAETSKDIDVLVVADDADAVMDAVAGSDLVAEVTARGPTKLSVVLAAGPGADLRVVEDAAFPFAAVYFTGSKEHNIRLRARAQDRGLKLNEYALTRDDGTALPCADERAVYAALDLAWVPPELREDRGEIEAAERDDLPALVERDDLAGVLHCHSTWSDGAATVAEMAEGARARGYAYLGLCDHSQSAAYAGGLDPERVRAQHEEVDALNARYDGAFRVLKGIEVDILADGSLDYADDVLASFDLVVASVHSRFGLSEEEQTARVLRALDNPYVDILGHPTGRLLLSRDPYPIDLRKVVDRAIERGVAVEVNAHPQRLDLDWDTLRWGLGRGLRTAINPDAHDVDGLDVIDHGLGIARKGGCRKEDVLNAWSLERLLDHLAARRRDVGSGRG